MTDLLDQIKNPEELRRYSNSELENLAAELRAFISRNVAETGGHLASNLGTIELTLALLHCFDFRRDRVVWDVGHQTYAYKILTGRKEAFSTLRRRGGLSGFPKREESSYDFFNTGHSSTALSAALGISRARRARGEDGLVVAVVGDGAATGGLFYEALNNIDADRDRVILVINDNEMSISPNVGLLSKQLKRLRVSQRYMRAKSRSRRALSRVPLAGAPIISLLERGKRLIRRMSEPGGSYFESLGMRCYGPVDGHNIRELTRYFNALRRMHGPAVLHVCTQKGKGYEPAELAPDIYHGVAPFSLEQGIIPSPSEAEQNSSFTDVFSKAILAQADKRPELVALTAAMAPGTGLSPFASRYPERFYDVGIAEQHELCMAAGLCAAGLRPLVCVYATFLQRALDQLVHDIALQKLPVVLCVDRSGFVGADGETHQGLYDSAFMNAVPGLMIDAPCCYEALEDDLEEALNQKERPCVIRYPKGSQSEAVAKAYHDAKEAAQGDMPTALTLVEYNEKANDNDVDQLDAVLQIFSLGRCAAEALELAELCRGDYRVVRVTDAGRLKPLAMELLDKAGEADVLVTIEEAAESGSLASTLALKLMQRYASENVVPPRQLSFYVGDHPVEQSTAVESRKDEGLDAMTMYERLKQTALKERKAGGPPEFPGKGEDRP